MLCFAVTSFSTAVADDQAITPVEGDFTIERFEYGDGNVGSLTQHYRTLGSPRMDADGKVTNAVLIMHGTTGSGAGFLRDNYAGVLFSPGELLDASRYFLILPDSIGHGTPAVNTLWKTNMLVDDPVRASNIRGVVSRRQVSTIY